MCEEFLAEQLHEIQLATVIVATDGSVMRDEPRSGRGCVERNSLRSLHVVTGDRSLLLSSAPAGKEAASFGLDLAHSTGCGSQSVTVDIVPHPMRRKLHSGVPPPPKWHSSPSQ